MTAINTTVSILLVAIDISKHRHEILIGIPGKKRRRRLTITNKLEDFRCLAATLSDYDLPVRRKALEIGAVLGICGKTLGSNVPVSWINCPAFLYEMSHPCFGTAWVSCMKCPVL